MPTLNIARAFAGDISRNIGIEIRTDAPVCTQIFHMHNADSKFVDHQDWENYGPPSLQIPLTPVEMNEARQSFGKRYIFPYFASGDLIARQDWVNDRYGTLHRLLPARAGGMARVFKTFYDRVHAGLFMNLGYVAGTGVAGSPDGYCLFSTLHPTSAGNSTAISNRSSTDIDFSVAGYQACKLAIETQYEANGYTYIDNTLTQIVVNNQLQYVVDQVMNGKWEPYSANRTINPISKERTKYTLWKYFQKSGSTGTNNSWFGLGHTHELHSFMREAYNVDSDYDMTILAFRWVCFFAFGLGWSSFRGTWGSLGG